MKPVRYRVTIRWPRAKKRERWPWLRVRAKSEGGWKDAPGLGVTCKGISDVEEVERWRSDYEARLNAGITSSMLQAPTMDALFALRVESLLAEERPKTSTVKGYRAVRRALSATLGRCEAAALRKSDLIRAQGDLRSNPGGKPRSETTVRQYMAQALAVFRWAQDLDYLPSTLTWPRLGKQRKARKKKTKKRPYTDSEVAAILAWVKDYQNGKWLAVFRLLADTGARVNAVLGLRGRDVLRGDSPQVHFNVQWEEHPHLGVGAGHWSGLKTDDADRVVPILPSTAELLPLGGPDEPLWPNARDPRRPARPETIRDVLRKALKAVGIADMERVDTHSLRRAWVRTAKREGVADAIGMRVTGHTLQSTYDGYESNSTDDEEAMRAAVMKVWAARERARGQHLSALPPTDSLSPPENGALVLTNQGSQDLTS